MNTKLLLLAIFLGGVLATAEARPREVEPGRSSTMRVPIEATEASAREDTFFLFAAEGPGAYGMPGTTERGYSFDGPTGAAEEAGWYGLDATAQEGHWWHVAEVSLCAGTDTDMSAALPFDYPADPENSYAAWCGRSETCGWANDMGYGNDWDQWMRVNLAPSSELVIDFDYSAFFEGTQWDYFQVLVEVDGELEEFLLDNTEGPSGFLSRQVEASGELGDVVFSFLSDNAWSDQDGLFDTNLGAVWIDNIVIQADGQQVFAADFEDGFVPPEIEFTEPEPAGDYAALHDHLHNDDPCVINETHAWAFFDSLTLNPEYGNHPVIPYGPPYVENYVVSPVLSVDQIGRELGFDLIIDDTMNVIFDFWVKRSLDLDALIFFSLDVAAQVEGQDCLGPWTFDLWDPGLWPGWDNWIVNVTEYLMDSAGGGSITGIVVRLGVRDMCPWWCDSEGSGDSHPPEPFFDNMSVYFLEASPITWRLDAPDRFQDNFPEHGGPGDGFVRIDHAGDFDWNDEDLPVSIVDSLEIKCDMDGAGGVAMEFCDPAGELRPRIYMWYRMSVGPHAENIDPDSGDPFIDPSIGGAPTDGLCYSPWVGSGEIVPGDGEPWNIVQADFAHYHGDPQALEDRYAFDLNDAYFLPGDEIEYIFVGYANDGSRSTAPANAMSVDPQYRKSYLVRCLPSGNSSILFVADGYEVEPFWREAFYYNGVDADIFTTQAPSSGQSNGLASRATLEDLQGYGIIIWDSGNTGAGSICDEDDKTRDDQLLTNWITFATQSTYAWFLGDNIANDLDQGDPFLTGVLGATLIEPSIYYDDRTGVVVPLVYGTHPLLQYLGGDPYFWVYGGCPVTSDFALVAPTGALTEIFQEWEVDPGDNAKAGLLYNDPDGNGQPYNDQGTDVFTKVVFNPYSYYHVRDAGYATSAGVTYHRVFVGHVLENVFDKAVDPPIDVDETPAFTKLDGNFPNPFNPKTTIRFALANAGDVNLTVYDITGRAVKVLVDGHMDATNHEVVWDGSNNNGDKTASGVYFYKLHADGKVFTEKMVLLK